MMNNNLSIDQVATTRYIGGLGERVEVGGTGGPSEVRVGVLAGSAGLLVGQGLLSQRPCHPP